MCSYVCYVILYWRQRILSVGDLFCYSFILSVWYYICVMLSQVKALMGKLKDNTNLLIGELCVICFLVKIWLSAFSWFVVFCQFEFSTIVLKGKLLIFRKQHLVMLMTQKLYWKVVILDELSLKVKLADLFCKAIEAYVTSWLDDFA